MNLARILVEHGQKQPYAISLVYKERQISYGSLEEVTNRFANSLTSLGINHGKRVALICPNIPEFVISFLSILKTGATVIPVNFLFKKDELHFVLEHSKASYVIVAAPFLSSLLSLKNDLPCLEKIISFGTEEFPPDVISYEEIIRNGSSDSILYHSSDDDTAVILYTSGTTGRLKGAMLSHYNIYHDVRAANEVAHRGPTDSFLVVLPLFHAYGMTACMFLGLLCGAKLILMEKFVPHQTAQAIEELKVTVFLAVPSIYGALLLYSKNLSKEKFQSLELCISGGAPMAEKLQRDFEEFFGCAIIEGDGPTECSPVTSLNPTDGVRKIGSIGLPLPGVEMKIFDENNCELPDETIGEIVVKGPTVMKGYLDDIKSTEEAMTDGWFHTGDLGKRDKDGYFYIVDRKKDLIITGGMNVYPREIEEFLFKHPSVQEAAVTSKPDRLRGEVVQAFVVLKEGEKITEKELISYCRESLAKFKVPREITFMESLPKSYTGKVLKRILREKSVLDKLSQSV